MRSGLCLDIFLGYVHRSAENVLNPAPENVPPLYENLKVVDDDYVIVMLASEEHFRYETSQF